MHKGGNTLSGLYHMVYIEAILMKRSRGAYLFPYSIHFDLLSEEHLNQIINTGT